jgi:hypothetical protein
MHLSKALLKVQVEEVKIGNKLEVEELHQGL